MNGYVHSIETLGLVDGPGVRVVIFLSGCHLRCSFCHNPDTWNINNSKEMSINEIITFVNRYKDYFGSNGGVTISGGEPLVQTDFLISLLKRLKEEGIHTCLDTAGVGGTNNEEVLKYIDLVIYDIKSVDKVMYKRITGEYLDESLKFLELCQKLKKKLWLRQVIIPTINDNEEYIIRLRDFISKLSFDKIELIPYHTKGNIKYEKLNIPYKLKDIPDMDIERCNKLYELLIGK